MTWRRGKKAHSLWLYDLFAFSGLHFGGGGGVEGNGGRGETKGAFSIVEL